MAASIVMTWVILALAACLEGYVGYAVAACEQVACLA